MLHDTFDGSDEAIQLGPRSVDVSGDAHSVDLWRALLLLHGLYDDAMLVPQVIPQFLGVHAGDLEYSKPAGRNASES